MVIFKKGSEMMKKRILALFLSAMFCLSVAAVQVTEDTTVSLTANSDTSYEIADGVTLTIDVTGMTNTLSGCITGTGTAKLRKTGLGTLALSNANNSVSGGIFVDQGTLRADAQGCLGEGPITIAFTTAAKGNVSFNAQDATFNNDFTITGAGSDSIFALSTHKNVTLNGSITAAGALSLQNYPVKGTSASANKHSTTYNGDITIPTTKQLYIRTYGTNVFNGAITANTLKLGGASSANGDVYVNNPSNRISGYSTYRPRVFCGNTNVLRDAYFSISEGCTRADTVCHGLFMNGFDQRLNYLQNIYHYKSPSAPVAGACPIQSETPCTLTLVGKDNKTHYSGHVMKGAVSLVVDAENSGFVQCFSNIYINVTTKHSTTGTVTVKNGTLMIRGDKTSFAGVPQFTVESGGTLKVDTRGQVVFETVTNFTVNGSLIVEADAGAPFMPGVASLTLGEDASFTVNNAEKGSFSGAKVQVGGEWIQLPNGDYEYPDERVPQLKAGGFTVSGAASTVAWTGGGGTDTAITNADNWAADSIDLDTGLVSAIFATGGNTATVSTPVNIQNITFSAAEGEDGFTLAKGSDDGAVTMSGTTLEIADTDSTNRTYSIGVPLTFGNPQPFTLSIPGNKTLAFDGGFDLIGGSLTFAGEGKVRIGGVSVLSDYLRVPDGLNMLIAGSMAAPNDADHGLAQSGGSKTITVTAAATSTDGRNGLVVSNAVIRKPICIKGGSAESYNRYGFNVEGGSTNVVYGNVLLMPTGAANIRMFTDSEVTFRGGVRATKGPIVVMGETSSRALFADQPVSSCVETYYGLHFGFIVTRGRAVFDATGNSILYLRTGKANDAYVSALEFMRSDMFSSTNTTLASGMYNNSSTAFFRPVTANATHTVEFHSTTQRFARVVAGPKATFNGDEGALLEIYGAQMPDDGDAPHVTETNLYVAAAFTGGLSLKMGGTGTLLLTNAVSSTSGGIEVTNGVVRFASNAAWTNASYIAVGGTGRLEIEAETGLGRIETFPKTAALSLAGEGVISIPDGDELRFGSLTVDGATFSCGRYTYETAPEPLKAHLAETTGSIVVCRTGTLFMIQ